MAKDTLPFEEFLQSVQPEQRDFAQQTHETLLTHGCTYATKPAASGPVASYTFTRTKRVVANFVFRKGGLVIRLYGDHINRYADALEALPDDMRKSVLKAPACKQLMDPPGCNSRCAKGYVFDLDGETQRKCRYSCFQFDVRDEHNAVITDLLMHELNERTGIDQ